jgi:ABC-type antimicrobial peptide transport system permease subunit
MPDTPYVKTFDAPGFALLALLALALGGGAIVIIVLGLAACFVPAVRATRVNPVAALRSE